MEHKSDIANPRSATFVLVDRRKRHDLTNFSNNTGHYFVASSSCYNVINVLTVLLSSASGREIATAWLCSATD